MPVKKYLSSISHISKLLYGVLLYRSKIVSFVWYSKRRMQTLACFVNRGHSGRGGFEGVRWAGCYPRLSECYIWELHQVFRRSPHMQILTNIVLLWAPYVLTCYTFSKMPRRQESHHRPNARNKTNPGPKMKLYTLWELMELQIISANSIFSCFFNVSKHLSQTQEERHI